MTHSPIAGENVSVPLAAGKTMSAYLVKPAADAAPGVIIIHEIFGLTESIRETARRFSAEGYAALAVDLFSSANRALCILRIMHGMLIRPLQNGVVGDLQAAFDYLQHRPGVDSRHIGVIGFCMGGSYALQLACVNGEVRVAAPFYAANPRPLEAVAKVCPVAGSYPGHDFTTVAARKLEAALEQYQIPHDIKIYPDAKHSFFNPERSAYNASAAADAWARTLAFFGKYLKEQA
jgi:carboxymethylenebutenolidase